MCSGSSDATKDESTHTQQHHRHGQSVGQATRDEEIGQGKNIFENKGQQMSALCVTNEYYLVLTSDVPHCEGNVLVLNSFNVESCEAQTKRQ